MAEEKAWNKITGKKIATEDFSFTDKKSKPIHKGDIFNIKDIPEEYRSLAASKEYSKVEPGIVRKFINNTLNRGDIDGDKIENKSNPSSISQESSNKSFQKSINSSNTAQNQRSDKSPEYKSQHGSTPSNQSASSINENGKNVNLNS